MKKFIMVVLLCTGVISAKPKTFSDFKDAIKWEIDQIAHEKQRFGKLHPCWGITIYRHHEINVQKCVAKISPSHRTKCLSYAVQYRCYRTVEHIFAQWKALDVSLHDDEGYTPLQRAASLGEGRMAVVILQYAYNQAGRSLGTGYEALQELLDQKAHRTTKKTALTYAKQCTAGGEFGKAFLIQLLRDSQSARNAILRFEGKHEILEAEKKLIEATDAAHKANATSKNARKHAEVQNNKHVKVACPLCGKPSTPGVHHTLECPKGPEDRTRGHIPHGSRKNKWF